MVKFNHFFSATIGVITSTLLGSGISEAAVFNINSFPLDNGYTLGGTMTTDDTIGTLSANNITDYEFILAGGENPFTYTPFNSNIIVIEQVQADPTNSEIFVSTTGDSFGPNLRIDATSIPVTFFAYDFRNIGGQRLSFESRFNFTPQTFITPIPGTEGDTFAIATVQGIETTPEPTTVLGLLGLGLGFVAVKKKKNLNKM